MLYNHTICLQKGGYPVKKQAIALLLAAVLVLSGCGRQQLPEETPADMGLAAVAAIESHTPPTLKLTEAQTPPEEPVEEPEEPDWSAGSSDYPWVRSGYAYYIRVNRSANVVTVYTAGDDGRYSVPYRAMVCSSGGSGTPLGDFSLDGWYRWEWLGLVGGVSGQYCTQIYGDYLFHSVPYTERYNKGSLQPGEFDKLGTSCSHGCIRLQVADAKWIYDNKYDIAGVTIYDSDDPGPLGKPSAPSIGGSAYPGWDPTDPDSDNPWNKPADVTPEPKPEPDPEPKPEPEPDPEPGEAPDTGDDTQPDPAPGGEDTGGE